MVFERSKEEKDDRIFISELDSAVTYVDKLLECKTILREKRLELELEQAGSLPQIRVKSIAPNKLKLPELPLPKFSYAKGETLISFLASFESIISAYSLSSYEKFVFLKRQLSGPPLVLVESLELSKQSYESAVELLKHAFASDVVQKFDVIQRLRDLKCTRKPYEYVCEMRLVKDLFTPLKIDVDTVLQFFVWSGLTTELQNQLVSICNTNEPSLSEIEQNIFKALDRLNEIKSKRKSDAKLEDQRADQTTNFAVRITPKETHNSKKYVQLCSLCSDRSGPKVTTHSTRDSPVPYGVGKTRKIRIY